MAAPKRTRKKNRTTSDFLPEPLAPASTNDGNADGDGDGDGQARSAPDAITKPATFPFPVAAIVGSAGSLDALLQIASALPADLQIAVLVAHYSNPDAAAIPKTLAPKTHLPVRPMTNGMDLQPGAIYVAPPDVQIDLRHHKIFLTPLTPESAHGALDAFLTSLAKAAGPSAMALILAGPTPVGAMGLREIREAGGIALAQDPATTEFQSLPRAAILAGLVDASLPPDRLAEELVSIARHPLVSTGDLPARHRDLAANPPVEQLPRIFALLRTASGVDFTHYKHPTILRRMQRRMVLRHIHNVEQYATLLAQNPAEVSALYQDILIHVTRFFRDPESFPAVTQALLPRITDRRDASPSIRIWVPGCSTGEEPYSIAITLLEAIDAQRTKTGADPRIQIFATDVSDLTIKHARAGVYHESIASDISPECLRRFFTKIDGTYRVAKQVRDCCIFARQDLTRDPPFSNLDLIVCRNVLIYLGPQLQKRLINVFHYALKPTGLLMLGGAETVGPQVDLFAIIDKRNKLYVKRLTGSHIDMEFPPNRHSLSRPVASTALNPADDHPTSNIQAEANKIVLAKYSPPGVIVDSEFKIVQFRGQTGQFLEPAPGEASLLLLKMAREGLLFGLRSALHEARTANDEVRKDHLRLKVNGESHLVTVSVTPLGIGSSTGRYFLVLFEKTVPLPPETSKPKSKARQKADAAEDDRVSRLQQELAASREYLQSIIQDLEAANEELQSANEEILSSNEELQSTNEELDTAKEELQSTNEELNTVNEELEGRNDELMRANSDLFNLLASVQIAIVMVAGDLRIRRYTPVAEKVLNLIPSDIGRPISDIKPNIECPELEKLIIECIDSVTIKKSDVHDRAGRTYNLIIRPYKNVENKIDGAVITLYDLGEHRL